MNISIRQIVKSGTGGYVLLDDKGNVWRARSHEYRDAQGYLQFDDETWDVTPIAVRP